MSALFGKKKYEGKGNLISGTGKTFSRVDLKLFPMYSVKLSFSKAGKFCKSGKNLARYVSVFFYNDYVYETRRRNFLKQLHAMLLQKLLYNATSLNSKWWTLSISFH